jgi:hypothetical protein
MKIAKVLIGAAALIGVTAAYADGFDITRDMSNGRQLHLVEHSDDCKGGPSAYVYSAGKQVDQTCNVLLTPAGATVRLRAYDPKIFIPRDTLYPNS